MRSCPGFFPRTPLGSSRRSPRLLSPLGRGHPSPNPTPLGALGARPSRLRSCRLPLHIISGYATATCVTLACVSSCPCSRSDQCCYVCMICRIYSIFYPLMIHVHYKYIQRLCTYDLTALYKSVYYYYYYYYTSAVLAVDMTVCLCMSQTAIGNESVPIQLVQCCFPGLAIFNAKI